MKGSLSTEKKDFNAVTFYFLGLMKNNMHSLIMVYIAYLYHLLTFINDLIAFIAAS
ncbi:hypothetical protein J2Y73_001323 [Peribacillus frigoritolerans]|nr:hypothetical protein [Peribacillus frigoritolerans]